MRGCPQNSLFNDFWTAPLSQNKICACQKDLTNFRFFRKVEYDIVKLILYEQVEAVS